MERVIIAKTAGFCMGVRRAVNLVLELMERTSEPIWTIGPLIHNPQVVELLKNRGVISANSLEEISQGIVVIRSHGIRPELRKKLEERGLKIIDATCPRVARVHKIVEKFAEQGSLIIILGDPGHSEVEGILGFAGRNAFVVQTSEEVENLPEANQVVFVAQTTQSQKRFEQVAEAVKRRYKELLPEQIQIINTICDSTEERQAEVRKLAQEVDAFVIVGGKESANTRRLKEMAEACGKPGYLVEREQELDLHKLEGVRAVGLTAGASTPNWMIRRVYEELYVQSLKQRRFPVRIFYQGLRFFGILNFYLGLGGALLTALVGILLSQRVNYFATLASFFYISSVHNFNLVSSPGALEVIEPARGKFFLLHQRALLYLSIAGLILSGVFCALISPWALLFYLGLCILSLLYRARIRTGDRRTVFRFRSLMEIPASKDLFSALGWSVMLVLIPQTPESHFDPRVWLIFALLFVMVMARSMLQDFRDLQADRLVGKETIPIWLGPRASRILIHSLLALAVLIFLSQFWLKLFMLPSLGLLFGLFWLWLSLPFFTTRPIIQGLRAELLIDFSFILAGLVGLILEII